MLYKPEEKAVVSYAHARTNPCAMVVKLLHTVVAVAAMETSWRPEDLASRTVLQFEHHG